jgi:hypothetical protein
MSIKRDTVKDLPKNGKWSKASSGWNIPTTSSSYADALKPKISQDKTNKLNTLRKNTDDACKEYPSQTILEQRSIEQKAHAKLHQALLNDQDSIVYKPQDVYYDSLVTTTTMLEGARGCSNFLRVKIHLWVGYILDLAIGAILDQMNAKLSEYLG